VALTLVLRAGVPRIVGTAELTGGVETTTLDGVLEAVVVPSGLVAVTVKRTKSASSAVCTV
jgi:hypothetical protein